MRHLEEFTASALATLRAGLPDALVAINAGETDFEVKAPLDGGGSTGTAGVAYSDGTTPILSYPHVEVAIPDTEIFNPSLHWVDASADYTIIVRAMYQDPVDGSRLSRALQRTSRAMLNVLLADDAFGPHEVVSRVRVSLRTNPETGERDEVTGGVLHVYTVTSDIGPQVL